MAGRRAEALAHEALINRVHFAESLSVPALYHRLCVRRIVHISKPTYRSAFQVVLDINGNGYTARLGARSVPLKCPNLRGMDGPFQTFTTLSNAAAEHLKG